MEKQPLRDLRNRNLRNIAFITIVVILGLILLQSLFGSSDSGDEVSYSEFRNYVTSGQVVQVVIKDDVASAVLADGSTITARLPEDAAAYQALLDEFGGVVNYESPSNSGILTSIFISLLPILLLIAVWVYIMRRTQTGGGALSFGQSKAKLVKPDSTEVKFTDVAGIDEVTAEVE